MKFEKNKIEIVVYETKVEDTDSKGLRRFNKLCKALDYNNISIKRYSYAEDRDECMKNNDLSTLIYCAGIEMLPATYVNGKIEKIEAYPTKKDIRNWLLGFLTIE